MRLRKSLPLALTATPALALAPAPALALTHTPVPASPRPTCAAPDTRDFPIKTRIHGGPATYDVGGDFRTWYIDLTNTTAHSCASIHPIVVLVDAKGVLRPGQARLEFYEGERTHPVTFETSDEAENVGAFDDGFPGFTVGPGRTLTVKVRLSVTSDATAPNDVVANAAVVQRHNDDGDWVGESNEYRFRIQDEAQSESESESGIGSESPRPSRSPSPSRSGSESPSASESTGQDAGAAVGVESSADSGGGDGRGGNATQDQVPSPDELARTGPGAGHRLGVAAGLVLFVAGAALFAVTRRVRLRRR
ncbi:hypothetical protein GCM10011579_012220 [Streptomyces albiflavescens]|uniref:Gram-positive cocci surface proteins LPxTG domain-containing protein n=1 Tax=Streptomyces albiflavescens TaxID=1623582 RepID=A0A917XVQ7_9ACTN|nr:hypothetical protein [Streptomyces albiflavescens]GGN53720.1 hypothetical protein GCM10011579_012220 [Streptomyces albiflavescens]